MNRRDFLKGTAAAVAVATIPFKLGSVEDKNRTVEIDTEDGWKQIEMSYLKAGDIFRIRENGVTVGTIVRAAGKSHVQDGVWGVQIYKEKLGCHIFMKKVEKKTKTVKCQCIKCTGTGGPWKGYGRSLLHVEYLKEKKKKF